MRRRYSLGASLRPGNRAGWAPVVGWDLRQLMSLSVIGRHSDERIDTVLATMKLAKNRPVPVVDGGGLKGIVSE